MPLVNARDILQDARARKYGIPSLLAGNLEMVVGAIKAAEERGSPLILAFNQDVTPRIPLAVGMPMVVNAARRARVPVATILDHGKSLEEIVQAIHLGSRSVMFDGSALPYEENIRQTTEIVRIAHALGVCVEAELGAIGGSVLAAEAGDAGSSFTDSALAADFVERTGVDTLAISFGNVHGVYQGEPRLDLERVRQIYRRVKIPLVMHGASGLADREYAQVIDSGISKICYYTAMGRSVAHSLKQMLADADDRSIVYHHIIDRSIQYFCAETKNLLDLLRCSGTVRTTSMESLR